MFDLDLFGAPAFLIDVGAYGYRFRCINRAREAATGSKSRDVEGRSPFELFSAAVAEHLVEQFTNCVARVHALDFEEDIGVSGAKRTWLTTLSPLLAPDGTTVTHLLGIGVDITDRKLSEDRAKQETLRAEREARDAHSRLRDAIESLPEAIVFLDADERYILWNRKYAELYSDIADLLAPGVRFSDVLRASIDRGTMPEVVDDANAWMAKRLHRLRHPGPPEEEEYKQGRWIRHEERRTTDGGTIGVRIDITDLKSRERSFRLLFSNNPVPMYVYDLHSLAFIDVNEAAIAGYGHTREQFLRMTILDIRPESEHAKVSKAARQPLVLHKSMGIWQHSDATGRLLNVEIFAQTLQYNGRPAGLVAAVDVTERLRAEARIAHLAHHDPLTGLPNRTLFLRSLAEEFTRQREPSDQSAILYLDIDNFKDVNDRFGHGEGDSLLRQVSRRLRDSLRAEDLVARLGGDEFAVVRRSLERVSDAGDLATRIVDFLAQPFVVADQEVVIGASVGIALFPCDAESSDEVLRRADTALYCAKEEGRRTFRFFESAMDARLQARRALVQDIRQAFAAEAFHLEYQPVVDIETGRIKCCEALLRWRHPERGLIPPSEFIPIAEDIGLIVELGNWTLRQVCAEAASWPDEVRVAVNLSPVQFRSDTLVRSVMAALAASGLRRDRLEIEITETVLLADDESNRSILTQLRGLGIHIALDDFGTGYSSLGYLRSFPIDKIKIDRSFVNELATSRPCEAIIRAVAGLGRALNIETTAEGVETLEQLEALRSLGCTQAQGYVFSPPVPPDLARAMLYAQWGFVREARLAAPAA